MKLIWMAIEPDIQDLVDRELRILDKTPEFHKSASELIRLRRQRRAAGNRASRN